MISKINKNSIFTVHHKPHSLLNDFSEFTEILQVGTNENNIFSDLNDLSDTNIAVRNYCYAEMTGIYTVWKFHKQKQVCFQHYRRIFSHSWWYSELIDTIYRKLRDKHAKLKRYNYIYGGANCISDPHRFMRDLNKLNRFKLSKGTVVVPRSIWTSETVKEQFIKSHGEAFWDLTYAAIAQHHTELAKSFHLIGGQNELTPYNMFIMNWCDFDEYCSTVFPIFDSMYNTVNKKLLIGYNARFIGFMAERIFTAYLHMKRSDLNIRRSKVNLADFEF